MDRSAGTAMPPHFFRGLPPVIGKSARVVILGSFPSTLSLLQGEYYGNPQNHFWKIMDRLFSLDHHLPYPDRTDGLMNHHIALWDVIQSCRREGSADQRIREPLFNDIAGFLITNPGVQLVVLNGNAAGRYYHHLHIPPAITAAILPSTSPANTRFTFAEKVSAWEIVRTCTAETDTAVPLTCPYGILRK